MIARGENKNTHNIHQAFGKPEGATCVEVTVKFLFEIYCLLPHSRDTKKGNGNCEKFSKFEYRK